MCDPYVLCCGTVRVVGGGCCVPWARRHEWGVCIFAPTEPPWLCHKVDITSVALCASCRRRPHSWPLNRVCGPVYTPQDGSRPSTSITTAPTTASSTLVCSTSLTASCQPWYVSLRARPIPPHRTRQSMCHVATWARPPLHLRCYGSASGCAVQGWGWSATWGYHTAVQPATCTKRPGLTARTLWPPVVCS